MEELLSKIEFTYIPIYKYNNTDIQDNIKNNTTLVYSNMMIVIR